MARTIEISVRERIAWQTNHEEYICGNGDFYIEFIFDSEWDEVKTKTARFVYGDQHADIVFDGNRCNVPVILGASSMKVGVYGGDLRTTTSATVQCKKSILCDAGLPADPTPDVYAQIIALIEQIEGGMVDTEYIKQIVDDYLAENPSVPAEVITDTTLTKSGVAADAKAVGDALAKIENGGGSGGTTTEQITQIVAAYLAENPPAPGPKGDKGDKGDPGKDGYTPQKGVDYYTAADKAEMVNAVISALPVYNGEVVDV